MRSVTCTREMLSGIPFYFIGNPKRRQAPYAILLHGFTGNAVHMFDYGHDLAAAGVNVIAFDQRNHGARCVDAARNGLWSRCATDAEFFDMLGDMYGTMLGTMADVSLFLDLLPLRFGMDSGRIGITGSSLGGHVTLLAMAHDPRLAVGAPMIGGGDFLALARQRTAKFKRSAAAFERYHKQRLGPVLKRHDPIENAAAFAGRPLLMTNGDADDVVPITCNQRLLRRLRPVYAAAPERLRLSPYKGVGHAIPEEMWKETREWLLRWL